jgi:uncharacterized protein YkwD
MGSGASVDAYSDNELLAVATEFCKAQPERFEAITAAARSASQASKQQAENMDAHAKTVVSSSSITERIKNNESVLISQEIADEISLMRADPPAYSEFIQSHLDNDWIDDKCYKNTNLAEKEEVLMIRSEEGKPAVREAIEELKRTSSLPPMLASSFLEMAAVDHQVDSSKNNIIGHTGSDGSRTQDRISRHCAWKGSCGENVDYGNVRSRDIVIHLLIDDGVPDRGHRRNLLAPSFLAVGAVLGYHETYRCCCVMDFATSCVSLDDIVNTDCDIVCQPPMVSPEVMKVLNSMPIEAVEYVNQITAELQEGFELNLHFKPSVSLCEFEYKKGNHTKTRKLQWSTSTDESKL